MIEVSIIIPAYNEEKNISNVINKIGSCLEEKQIKYEIIVVNDGSTDRTEEMALKSRYLTTLISHSKNLGYGASIKTGLKTASYPWIAIIDADGTYPEEEIYNMIIFAEKHDLDMVVGARIGKDVKIPTIRKPVKFLINKLANYLTGKKIPDLNSGLRIIKKNILEKFLYLLPDGFSFTSTITLAMLANNYEIGYYPISYFKRTGKSKIRPIRDTINFIQLIIRTVMYFEPLKIFIPISLILFLMAVIAFILRQIKGGGFAITIVILLTTSLHMLAIGMLADLIDKRLKEKNKN